MPARVRALAAAGVLTWLAATAAATRVAAGLSPALGALFAGASILAALYALFVYHPKFDPSTFTRWRGPKTGGMVALTFDDGPGPDTGRILDVLKEKGISATFFCLGENAMRHPGLVARAKAEGHAVGNHGLTHTKLHRVSEGTIVKEVLGGERSLGGVAQIGVKKIIRVPHGFKSFTLVRTLDRLGYTLIAWTHGVWDSDRPGADIIAARAIAVLRPGGILLLHDGDGARPDADRSQTAAALPAIIDYCLKAGYKFVTIPQLFS